MDGLGTAGNRQRGRPPRPSETVLTLYLVKRIRIESRAPPTAPPPSSPSAFYFYPSWASGAFPTWPSPLRASAASSCISGSSWGTWPSAGARHPLTCAFGFMLLFSGIVLGELAAWTPTASPASATRRPCQHRLAVHARRELAWSMATAPTLHTDRRDGRRALLRPSFIKRRDGFRFRRQSADAAARLYAAAETLRPVAARVWEVTRRSFCGALIPSHLRRAVHRQKHRPNPRSAYLREDEHHRRPPRAHRPHRGLRLVTVPAMPSAKVSVIRAASVPKPSIEFKCTALR